MGWLSYAIIILAGDEGAVVGWQGPWSSATSDEWRRLGRAAQRSLRPSVS
jgi:hypothetical protein